MAAVSARSPVAAAAASPAGSNRVLSLDSPGAGSLPSPGAGVGLEAPVPRSALPGAFAGAGVTILPPPRAESSAPLSPVQLASPSRRSPPPAGVPPLQIPPMPAPAVAASAARASYVPASVDNPNDMDVDALLAETDASVEQLLGLQNVGSPLESAGGGGGGGAAMATPKDSREAAFQSILGAYGGSAAKEGSHGSGGYDSMYGGSGSSALRGGGHRPRLAVGDEDELDELDLGSQVLTSPPPPPQRPPEWGAGRGAQPSGALGLGFGGASSYGGGGAGNAGGGLGFAGRAPGANRELGGGSSGGVWGLSDAQLEYEDGGGVVSFE